MAADQQQMAEINRALGGVEAAIKSLNDRVQYHQTSSEEGRRRLYEKFEGLADDVRTDVKTLSGAVSSLSVRVDGLAARLEVIEPTITTIKEERLMKKGAADHGKRQWGWILAGSGFMGWIAHEATPWISALLGRSPPPHGP